MNNVLGLRFRNQSSLQQLTSDSIKRIYRSKYNRPQVGYALEHSKGILTFLRMEEEMNQITFKTFKEILDQIYNTDMAFQYTSEIVNISEREWIHISYFLRNPEMTTSMFATLHNNTVYVCTLGCKKEEWEGLSTFYHEVIRTLEFDVWDEV